MGPGQSASSPQRNPVPLGEAGLSSSDEASPAVSLPLDYVDSDDHFGEREGAEEEHRGRDGQSVSLAA